MHNNAVISYDIFCSSFAWRNGGKNFLFGKK